MKDNALKTFSVITINFNNANGLKKTIESVANQTITNIEYIIIDGGSTDDSLEIIKGYENNISYWVSEPDGGVYDAMNKGILKATGEYVIMLNSGDYFCSNSILEKVRHSMATDTPDIVFGDVIWDNQGHQSIQCFPDVLTFGFFRKYSIGHQAAFIKRNLHERIGFYDSELKFISDWKFFIIAFCLHNISYHHLNFPIAVCGRDGISCDPKNFFLINDERRKTLENYFKAFLSDYQAADVAHESLYKIRNLAIFKLFSGLMRIRPT